jgi:hypothetical protein
MVLWLSSLKMFGDQIFTDLGWKVKRRVLQNSHPEIPSEFPVLVDNGAVDDNLMHALYPIIRGRSRNV